MNKLRTLFLIAGALLFFAKIDVSADGLVAFPDGDASWTVTFAPSPNAVPAPAPAPGGPVAPVKRHATLIQVTQLDNVKRTQITWSDGVNTEHWSIPPMPVNFEEDPRNGSIDPNLRDSISEGFIRFEIPSDAAAFRWMTPATLKEKDPISYQGKQCFHYVGADSPNPNVPPQKREAWIDSKTLQPVALDTGSFLGVFAFSAKPPVGPLVVPPKFAKAIAYYKLLTGYP